MQRMRNARRMQAGVLSSFVAPHRHRPQVKIVLSNRPSGERFDGFDTLIVNLNNDTPDLENVLLDTLTKLVSGFVEGRYSIVTMGTDEGWVFVALSDALVDCTPNQHGMDSWFDVLKTYVPGTFLDDLARRLMATYFIDVAVVDGNEPGLLITTETPVD